MNDKFFIPCRLKHDRTSQPIQAAVNRVVDAFFETIAKTVAKGGKVTIPGWLSVEKGHRAARTGRNPQTGATIQ
ncbi:MAG: hypothetical protein RLZZ359_1103, partial [Actinomycetota bacterium]